MTLRTLLRTSCLVGILALSTVPSVAAQSSFGSRGQDDVVRRIDRVVTGPEVDQAHWGILAIDLLEGDTLYALNPARKFIPASNMKILVTAGALWELGPDWRYRTELHAVGERVGEVLRGDLVLRPSGDPTLSSRFGRDGVDALRDLARQVAATGLRTVSGDLIVAAPRWDSTSFPGSWMTGNVPFGYSAVGGPLALAEGATTIEVRAGGVGDAATFDWTPAGTPDFVVGEVRTVGADEEADLRVTWHPESGVHRISGTIRAGRVDSVTVSTRRPVREARARLIQLLGEEGVAVLGIGAPATLPEPPPTDDSGSAYPDPASLAPALPILWAAADSLPIRCEPGLVPWCDLVDPIAWIESPPLIEIVRAALEPSQNWITEQLLKTLGLETHGVASWENGTAALERILASRAGIDTLDLALEDGSGLSAYNLVTPRSLVRVLETVDRSGLAEAWRDALAAPGEAESTLQYRLQDLEGRVQAKTGTISNVNSLSGYVLTNGGRRVAFAILTNGSGLPSARMRSAIDEVVRILASLDG